MNGAAAPGSVDSAEDTVAEAFMPGAIHQSDCHCLQVDLVLLPALTGDFGVMPGHVPTIAQLRPGVVTVHKTLDKDIDRYFVSSGFAFVHADSSADVCAIEAVKLDDLDPEAVRSGLQVDPSPRCCSQTCRTVYCRQFLLLCMVHPTFLILDGSCSFRQNDASDLQGYL